MTAKSRRQRLEEMLAQDPNDAFLRYGLAMDYAGGGDDVAAAKEFAELMRTAPDYVPGYLQAGQVLARLGRDDEARAVYRAGVVAAQRAGDAHAAGELQGFLDMLS
jgi:Tfp pilus assembly protein PilF